jgi:TolA-binding protein
MKDPVLTNQTRLGMAVCYLNQDKYDEAESLLAKAASGNAIDSTVERALFLLGDLSLYKGDFKIASDRFKQLVVRYPQGDYSNDALMRMDVLSLAGSDSGESAPLRRFAEAMKAMTLGRPQDAALALSDSTLAGSPIAEQTAFYCGISYSQAGSKRSAIDAFNVYIEKYPDGLYTDRAYLELGDLFAQDAATIGEAKAAYNKILETFPDGPVIEPARQRLRSIEKLEKIG